MRARQIPQGCQIQTETLPGVVRGCSSSRRRVDSSIREIAREGESVTNAKFRGDSRRTGFYERRIERCLSEAGFGLRQRERIESVGWSKLKEYVQARGQGGRPCR